MKKYDKTLVAFVDEAKAKLREDAKDDSDPPEKRYYFECGRNRENEATIHEYDDDRSIKVFG